MKSLDVLLGSQEPSTTGSTESSGEQDPPRARILPTPMAVLLQGEQGLCTSGSPSCSRAVSSRVTPQKCWMQEQEPSVLHRHSQGPRLLWGFAGRAAGSCEEQPLLLLNSMTIPALTFSIPAASRNKHPPSRLQQGPTVSITPLA